MINDVQSLKYAVPAQKAQAPAPQQVKFEAGHDKLELSSQQKSSNKKHLAFDAVALLTAAGGIFSALKYRKMATVDGLTNLFNKSKMSVDLRKAILEAEKDKKALALAFVDFDYFKSVNEVLGHKAGDDFLTAIGSNIKKTLEGKSGATGYRNGGEEFCLVFKNMSKEQASDVMKELTENIKKDDSIQKYREEFVKKAEEKIKAVADEMKAYKDAGKEIPEEKMNSLQKAHTDFTTWKNYVANNGFTYSGGVIEKNAAENVPSAMLERADQVLAKAKEQGRNKVNVE